MFVNRRQELDLLEKQYKSGKASFFVLYGRRRVGKTELLTHFCQDKRAIFFVADLDAELTQRTALSKAINAILFPTQHITAIYQSWEDLLMALVEAAKTEKLILVLDEFQYLVNTHPPLASLLQRIWDQHLKDTQIMLILCGSYIGMMEETVLGYQAPLYGRRSAQLLLEPLKFQDARLFFQNYSLEDQVRAYAIYGGTPAYLNTINPENTLSENILQGILTRGAYLYDEVRFILQQELREPRNYFAILQAIANGKTKQNEIKQATGINSITAYLDTLQQLHLVERKVPITEKKPQKSRRGLYKLKDHYLRFWFRYVHPNRSTLEQGGDALILDQQVLPSLDQYTSWIFEAVCQQFFWGIGLAGQLPFMPNKVGNWWRRSEEIDLLVLNETEAILVECKWTKQPISMDVLKNLERKVSYVQPDLGERNIQFALCSRNGFSPQMKQTAAERSDLRLYNLNEIINF